MADDEAIRLLEQALFLRQNGERPPGAPHGDLEAGTWARWERDAEAYLRAQLTRMADDEAWGGRGPSASYEEWLAEGQAGDGANAPGC